MRCPHCNHQIRISIHKTPHSDQWQTTHPRSFESTPPWETAPPTFNGPIEATKSAPARPASVESDVIVPLLQSLATGAAIALPTAALSLWLQWPWWSFLATGATTFTIAWLTLLGAHRRLLWIVETVSDLIEETPSTTKPKQDRLWLEVKHVEPAGHIQGYQYLDLPKDITQEMFIDWSQAVTNDIKTPVRDNWIGPGKPFSKDNYKAFSEKLEEAGILQNIPGKGRKLTVGGRHALKALIEERAAGGGRRRTNKKDPAA